MGCRQEKSHWFSFKDSSVWVIEQGSDPSDSGILGGVSNRLRRPIFFLHGRFGDAAMWNSLAESLSTQYPCFSVDLPGFGRSLPVRERGYSLYEHAGLMHELIKQMTLQDEKVILVGHDVGGGIAQLCALKTPKKIAGIVLINSACLAHKLGKVSVGLNGYLAQWKLRRLISESSLRTLQERDFLRLPWKIRKSRGRLTKALKAFEESWPWHYEQHVWQDSLRNLNSPVLLLWGGRDSLNPPEIAIEMVQKLPDVDFFLHETSGHWPSLEQPQWVLSKMREFIFRVGAEISEPVRKFLSK